MSREAITPSRKYIRKHYAVQDALLAEIDETLKKSGIFMQIAAEEGKLLQLLIKLHDVKTVVEVGTLAGYSAIWMARALPPGGHLYALNKDPRHIEMARMFFAKSDVASRITQLEGDAHDTLESLNGKGPFDMIFIDADKESYPDYLDWAEKHIRKGGLIVGDNTLLFGAIGLNAPTKEVGEKSWQAMRRFNERLADPKRYFSALIPTEDGLTVAIKLF